MSERKYWDISVPLTDGMVCWPGDPSPRLDSLAAMDSGAICNVTKLNMSVHVGTHMDAPRHFINHGAGIDRTPIDALIGPARVVEIHDPSAIRKSELQLLNPQPGERLLFKTRNSEVAWQHPGFFEDFVYIAAEAAQYLVECGVRTVGVDYLSIGGFRDDSVETHVIILGAGIAVIEGLNLNGIDPGAYELICLPLKIAGADGAPARAVLRR